MKELESKYGFPLFSTSRTTTNLLRFERNRVSDIWSFWDYIIKQHLKRNGKSTESFLSSLHEQSMYFYQAAEKAPLRSQPLLYYYSFLNLAKIFLCLTEGLDSSEVYQHGIKTDVDSNTTLDTAFVEVQSLHGSRHISVAHRLMTLFGDSVNPASLTRLSIRDCLESCVGIHRTYCETCGGEESFVRLSAPFCYQHGQTFGVKSELNRCTLKKMADLNGYVELVCKLLQLYFSKPATRTVAPSSVARNVHCFSFRKTFLSHAAPPSSDGVHSKFGCVRAYTYIYESLIVCYIIHTVRSCFLVGPVVVFCARRIFSGTILTPVIGIIAYILFLFTVDGNNRLVVIHVQQTGVIYMDELCIPIRMLFPDLFHFLILLQAISHFFQKFTDRDMADLIISAV